MGTGYPAIEYMKSNSSPQKQTTVAVFGSSRCQKGSSDYKQAFDLGYLIAKAGFTIINGGGPGSMEATALGAKEGKGPSIGATIRNADWQKPNEVMEKVIECDDIFNRIREIYERSDAFIVLNGGTGTLAEFAIVWNLISLSTDRPKPLLLLGTGWYEIIKVIQRNMMITNVEEDAIQIVEDAAEAVQFVSKKIDDLLLHRSTLTCT